MCNIGMSVTNLVYIDILMETCRACMCHGTQAVITISSTVEELQLHSNVDYPSIDKTLRIAELLTKATPDLQIELMDDFPKVICLNCLDKLMLVNQFQHMCRRSDKHFRALQFKNEHSTYDNELTTTTTKTDYEKLLVSEEDPLQYITAIPPVRTLFKQECNDYESVDVLYPAKVEAQEPIEVHFVQTTTSIGNVRKEKVEAVTESGENGKNSALMSVEVLDEKVKKTDKKRNRSGSTKVQLNQNKGVNMWSNMQSDSKKTACPVCGKHFRGQYRLNRHLKVHDSSERPYACTKCEYRFATHGKLKGHITEKHTLGQKVKRIRNRSGFKYQCDECTLKFDNEVALQTHNQEIHVKNDAPTDSKYSCEVCGKAYKTVHMLANHKRAHRKPKTDESDATKDELKPYVCGYCKKGFQQSCTLKEHIRTHTGEQPFLCSECGKSFNSSSNMKQHLLRHTGVLRYECPVCPKKFLCLSDLASHKAVHRQYKPHVCDICGSAFGKPSQLKVHKMYHSGEKPHKCEYCEMRFVCADHMRRHLRTHTGEKPYQCKYCERAFAQSNDLIKHLRSHLGENVYKCELCPRSFRLATELRVHFAEHKNDNEETRKRYLERLIDHEDNKF